MTTTTIHLNMLKKHMMKLTELTNLEIRLNKAHKQYKDLIKTKYSKEEYIRVKNEYMNLALEYEKAYRKYSKTQLI